MKTKTIQQLRGYLASSLGVGACAASAEGAMVVLDLSATSFAPSGNSGVAFPGGFPHNDVTLNRAAYFAGYMRSHTGLGAAFYSDLPSLGLSDYARGYSAGVQAFPTDPDSILAWSSTIAPGSDSGFVSGSNNWVAFKDVEGRYGWLNLSLDDASAPNTTVGIQLNYFVYDDAATSVANAPNLSAAVAAIPEPSSLALLALGAAGLISRRQRKKSE